MRASFDFLASAELKCASFLINLLRLFDRGLSGARWVGSPNGEEIGGQQKQQHQNRFTFQTKSDVPANLCYEHHLMTVELIFPEQFENFT